MTSKTEQPSGVTEQVCLGCLLRHPASGHGVGECGAVGFALCYAQGLLSSGCFRAVLLRGKRSSILAGLG